MFAVYKFSILSLGIGKARQQVFERIIGDEKGILVKNWLTLTSGSDDEEGSLRVLLVDDSVSVDQLKLFFASNLEAAGSPKMTILRCSWLSCCRKERTIVESSAYRLQLNKSNKPIPPNSSHNFTAEKTDPDEQVSSSTAASAESTSTIKRTMFACEVPVQADRKVAKLSEGCLVDENSVIVSELRVLADAYKSTNDKWRTLTYEKAIKTIQKFPEPISSMEQIRTLKGVGEKLAGKILEICQSGRLEKAEVFAQNEKLRTLNLFTNIWAVGPTTAEQWYVQGFRSLEDVRSKARLTRQQQIGLKYYDELLERMSREEARQIVERVRSAVSSSCTFFEACGSFRRGRPTCGDVDILICDSDSALSALVERLAAENFLTDHLVLCHKDKRQDKYMGVCQLSSTSAHRRVDVINVPRDELATALIYFTGSEHFTRSIYAKAKSMAMRLNQHGLRAGVMRQNGEKLNEGYRVETETEQSVFEALGIPYREPHERDI